MRIVPRIVPQSDEELRCKLSNTNDTNHMIDDDMMQGRWDTFAVYQCLNLSLILPAMSPDISKLSFQSIAFYSESCMLESDPPTDGMQRSQTRQANAIESAQFQLLPFTFILLSYRRV